jgi:hypothetical protein
MFCCLNWSVFVHNFVGPWNTRTHTHTHIYVNNYFFWFSNEENGVKFYATYVAYSDFLSFFCQPPYFTPKREKNKGAKKEKKNGNKIRPYTQLGRPTILGNKIQFIFLGGVKTFVRFFYTLLLHRVGWLLWSWLCHGDEKVQVGVLQRNHGKFGLGCCRMSLC